VTERSAVAPQAGPKPEPPSFLPRPKRGLLSPTVTRLVLAGATLFAVVFASAAIAQGYGVPAVGLIAAAAAIAACRRFRLALACSVLPVSLLPVFAMTSPTRVAGMSLSTAVGLLTLAVVITALIGDRPLLAYTRSLSPVLILVVVGLATSTPVTDTLKANLGLICVWIAGSLAGAGFASRPEQLQALLWLLAPTAVLAVLECIGLSNFWATATHATLFAAWPTFAGLHRAFSTFGHPVVAGSLFAMLFVMTTTTRPGHSIWLTSLYGAATVATLSRSAFLAVGVGVAVAFILAPRGRKPTLVAVTVFATVVLVALVALSGLGAALSARFSQNDNAGRVQSLAIAEASLLSHPGSVLFGGGFNGAADYFQSIGGNALTGAATGTLVDNEAITALYDFGLIAILAFISLVAYFAAQNSRQGRYMFLPPLATLTAALFAFDGLSWLSTGFFFFLCVGAVSEPTHMSLIPLPEPVIPRALRGKPAPLPR